MTRRGRRSVEDIDMERRVLERLASGEPVKVSTLRTATAASLPVLAGNAAQEVDCARDRRHGARCAAYGAFRCFDSRYAPACLDETPAGDSGGASGQWRRTAIWPTCDAAICRLPPCRRWSGGNWCASKSVRRLFDWAGSKSSAGPLTLNEPQMDALASIVSRLGAFHPFLLHGVTGSGKTAVYLKAMQRALDQGQSAILLVPEIGLTPQMVGLLDAAFGQRVALLHSALTPEERTEQWRRIHRGEAPIVVGTRSAIFAPVPEPAV